MFSLSFHLFEMHSLKLYKILQLFEYRVNCQLTVLGPLGDVLGSVVYPSLIDIIGRKKTILLIALPQLVSMSMIYFSFHSKVLLYSARFIGGLSEAACFTILPVYIGEVNSSQIIMSFIFYYITCLFIIQDDLFFGNSINI